MTSRHLFRCAKVLRSLKLMKLVLMLDQRLFAKSESRVHLTLHVLFTIDLQCAYYMEYSICA